MLHASPPAPDEGVVQGPQGREARQPPLHNRPGPSLRLRLRLGLDARSLEEGRLCQEPCLAVLCLEDRVRPEERQVEVRANLSSFGALR
eukprot:9097230-Lingulodinium_polyedra.AAC.1